MKGEAVESPSHPKCHFRITNNRTGFELKRFFSLSSFTLYPSSFIYPLSLKIFLFGVITLIIASCGYRSSLTTETGCTKSLSIPYVKGDDDGLFTAALCEKVAKKGLFRVNRENPNYRLIVELEKPKTETVGFRYEETQNGQFGKRLVSAEEKLEIRARVELIDLRNCCRILGPLCVRDDVVFDFAPDTSPQNDLFFSMGQLDFGPAATDAAKGPLYDKLSEQIADLIWLYGIN